ncbi:hypothetical protein AURDEDRAFT_125489 [Auricularia subglabra TFB-10046 SS5]|nr:hypothetical protein AURDEDRAFT_125489 [Auricularia subglabra TFB-10046 SS5]
MEGLTVAPEPVPIAALEAAANGILPSASTSSIVPAQKRVLPSRVLPSRVRRGGPGVGSHDIDLLILDTNERARTQAIIPETTRFILTTDSKLVPPKMDETRPNLTKYFSQPDIIQSMKAQSEIQTPEFSLLSESDAVGGRLRVRGVEENIIDMSEEAYIQRHRRYEAFEKKQRRREKEKLEYEQYKLRERLDQLRGLDVNAFAAPGLSPAEIEARRHTMLETAEMLDKRYAVLLPPDPKRVQRRRAQSVGPTLARATAAQSEHAEAPVPPTPARTRRGGTPAPFKARKELAAEAEQHAVELPPKTTPASTKKRSRPKAKSKAPQTDSQASTPKLTIKLPRRSEVQASDVVSVSDGGPPTPHEADPTFEPPGTKRRASSAHPSRAPKRARPSAPAGSSGAGLSKYGGDYTLSSVVRPAANGVPVLVAAARRCVVPGRGRKTTRNTEPFGAKIPPRVAETSEYELPLWVWNGWPDDDADDSGSVDGPPQYDGDVQHGPPRDFEMAVDGDGRG